ncbi:hypothetical protein XNW1_3370002 [Xenorhabdus nematophila str. Websteri]|nr:hypothetical protein XNW1_3370002 [Xenorhabdus nematophila str. Websteri]
MDVYILRALLEEFDVLKNKPRIKNKYLDGILYKHIAREITMDNIHDFLLNFQSILNELKMTLRC